MKVEITKRHRNELLKREELTFRLSHGGEGTPSRAEVRQKIADTLNVDIERAYVSKIETKKGNVVAVGEINVYDTIDQAKNVEPEHIILRNAPKAEKKE